MKIFGISMVRNEADIIGLTVLHNLSLGLDRVLVLDNGSTDGTGEILRSLSKEDERLKWIVDDSPFDQAAITTELAREAYRQGADWVVPFDADEFWWGKRGDFRRVLANSKAGALWVRPINFVQARGQHESTPEGLLTMTRRMLEPFPLSNLYGQLFMARQVSFVQMRFARKWISRPTGEVKIKRGNHIVAGVRGERARGRGLTCFHVPLRSRAQLEARAKRHHRLREANIRDPWHVSRHWTRVIEQGLLDEEWAANSYEAEHLDVYGKRYPVIFDPRLRNAVAPLFRRVPRLSPRSPSG